MARWEDQRTGQKAMLGGNITICRTRFPAEAFERSRMSFEGEEFSVPTGYDTILSTYYGDYMKLPPEGERDAKIKGIAVFDTEKSWREYRGKAYFVKE